MTAQAYGTAPVQCAMDMSPEVAKIMDSVAGVQVQQQRRMLEALTGFEQNNKYLIKSADGTDLFLAAEKSSKCERNCYPPDCGPWRMDVFQGVDASKPPVLKLDRPCTFTCCCFNRPEVNIIDPANGKIGIITDPFACCDMTFDVQDKVGTSVLKAKGGCCQLGLICPCPGCTVQFPITDSSGAQVAEITKIWMMGDHCPCCFKDWDNFQVSFGKITDAKYKALVTLLAVFIDFRYFNSRNQQ